MRVSKVNGLASWMLQTIFSRTAERLELPTIVGKFAKAYSASANGTPIPKDIVRDLRLYYWLLSNDVHGTSSRFLSVPVLYLPLFFPQVTSRAVGGATWRERRR